MIDSDEACGYVQLSLGRTACRQRNAKSVNISDEVPRYLKLTVSGVGRLSGPTSVQEGDLRRLQSALSLVGLLHVEACL